MYSPQHIGSWTWLLVIFLILTLPEIRGTFPLFKQAPWWNPVEIAASSSSAVMAATPLSLASSCARKRSAERKTRAVPYHENHEMVNEWCWGITIPKPKISDIAGWWLTYPSEKWWSEFVSWDDYSIPNWMESHKSHVLAKPPTSNNIPGRYQH